MEMRIKPRKKWVSHIKLPGDKSISHRAIMLGSIARGTSKIENLLMGEDCLSTLSCMEALSVNFRRTGNSAFSIMGNGIESLKEPVDVLHAGNSGTTMRLISGILCGLPFFTCITGDSSLNRRPMKRIITPLSIMGAKIWARGNNCYAPIAFQGTPLKGIEYELPVASAQVKSAILLAGLHADGDIKIIEKEKTRDHTENILRAMGAEVVIRDREIVLKKPETLSPLTIHIPGDISSAAFFLAACAGLKEGEIVIERTGINRTRTGFLEILKSMGADINIDNIREDIPGEPSGDIIIKSGELRGVTIDGDIVPRAIDELPLLAVLATQAQGRTTVHNAAELRVKETDRIKAIVSELRKLGATIEEYEDGFEIEGPTLLQGGCCKSYGDHRIAMSMAIAGLFAKDEIIIDDAECVNISFPEFFTLFHSGQYET